MTELERQLRASLADTAEDARFLAEIRAFVDARPLHSDGDDGVAIAGEDAARLVRLAEEALRARAKAPAARGPVGRLVALIDGDDRARLVAEIEFDDEDELRAAGRFMAADVVIAAAPPPAAANETEGQGSLSEDREP